MPDQNDFSTKLINYQRKLQNIIIKHQTGCIHDLSDGQPERKNREYLSRSEAGRANRLVYGAFHKFLSGENSPLGDGAEILISSFRSRRGVGETFLRTLHSDPEHVAKIFNAPDDAKFFQFTRATFGDNRDISHVKDEALGYHCFIRGYSIAECETASTTSTEFPARIWKFLNKEELEAYLKELEAVDPRRNEHLKAIKEGGSCIVFGRTKLNGKKKFKQSDDLQDLVALYFAQPFSGFGESQRENLCSVISLTLTAFSQIERFDREAFRRDAMTKITQLIPQFADKLTAPAMNMSKLLEELKTSFQKHPYFGTSTDQEDINIRFVRLDFLKTTQTENEKKYLLPKLVIYPPAYANIVALDATYFAHRHSRSVVKYLLGTWLKRERDLMVEGTRYEVHEDFLASNDSETTPYGPKFSYLDKKSQWTMKREGNKLNSPIGIYATALNDSEFWDKHNFRATSGETGAVTTAGYLLFKAMSRDSGEIEATPKKETDTKLPFGVLAFESKVPDAFAEEDLKILHELSVAVSHLIDLNGWSDVHVDYQTKIRKAMIEDKFGMPTADTPTEELKDIAFEFERLDRKTLEDWIYNDALKKAQPLALAKGQASRTTWQEAFVQMSSVAARSRSITQTKSEEIFHRALASVKDFYDKNTSKEITEPKPSIFGLQDPNRKWKRLPLDLFEKNRNIDEDLSLPDDEDERVLQLSVIKEFLESLPSQEEWNARLSAIPRALLSRELKNPVLSKFPTGFSAEAIYVLDDQREIRQILKFSDRSSISSERDKYQKFVRYHIPLAARMPQDGFAYDNNGYPPADPMRATEESYIAERRLAIEAKADDGFGVLVSDLVAGDQRQDNEEKEDQNASSVPHSLENKLFDLVISSPNSNNGDTNEFLQALSNHFVWKSVKWEEPIVRSFGSTFETWKTDIAQGEITRVILDSSRLRQFSDEAKNETSLHFDPKKPFRTIEKDSVAGSLEVDLRHANDVVFKFLVDCEGAYENSIKKYGNFITNYTKIVDFSHINLIKDELTFSGALDVSAILQQAWATISEQKRVVKSEHFNKLTAVIHGDSHGRNLTWSEEFRQFQMIDFEHVRFGYVFSDQIKLIVSTLAGFVSTSFSQSSQYKETEEDRVAKDFEEAILALTSFSEGLSSCAKIRDRSAAPTSVAKRLNENFFHRSFDLSEKRNLLKLRKSIMKVKHTDDNTLGDESFDDFVLSADDAEIALRDAFLTEEPRSKVLTRTIRRILGSCFHLPGIGNSEDQGLKTIDLMKLDPDNVTRDTKANDLFFGTFQQALKAFALKEFSYHLRNLDKQDIERIGNWNGVNEACYKDVKFINALNQDNTLQKFVDINRDALQGASTNREVAFDDYCGRHSSLSIGNNITQDISDKLFERFRNPRIKHMLRRMLGMFPDLYTENNHPDEKIVALASSYFVMLALFRYE